MEVLNIYIYVYTYSIHSIYKIIHINHTYFSPVIFFASVAMVTFFLTLDLEGSSFCNVLFSSRSNPSTFHLKEISIKSFFLLLIISIQELHRNILDLLYLISVRDQLSLRSFCFSQFLFYSSSFFLLHD